MQATKRSRLRYAGTLLAMTAALSGCEGFFVKPTSGGNTGNNTGNFAYVSNSASGPTYLAEYNLAAGTLAAVSGSPVNLGFVPVALAVAPSNNFLYAASPPDAASPGIYLYSIATSGALTAANNGALVAADQIAAIAVSPDGNWAFSVNVTGLVMSEYKVNTSTGLLTLATTLPLPGLGCGLSAGASTPASQTCSVAVGPSGAYVAVSLGAASTTGTVVFPYTSAQGISNAVFTPIPSGSTTSNPSGDFSVALDTNNYAYIARTSTLAVYAISSGSATLQATATFASGSVPRSTLLASTYNYVYTASQAFGTVSGFGIDNTGALTKIVGSPFSGPANLAALGLDKTGKYVIGVGYAATGGVQLYTVGATGALTAGANAPSGTTITYPAVLALTH